MELDKTVIDRVNGLKILHPSLGSLNYKDLEENFNLIREKVNSETAGEAINLFQEALKINPELKILNFFIAIAKLHFYPHDHFGSESYLNKFFHGLEEKKKENLAIHACELLEKHYSSLFVWEYMAKILNQKISQVGKGSEKEAIRDKLLSLLFKISQIKIDDPTTTELIANLLSNSPNSEEWEKAFYYYQATIEAMIKSNAAKNLLRLWNKTFQSAPILTVLESQEMFLKLIHTLNHVVNLDDEAVKKAIFIQTLSLNKANEMGNFIRILKVALSADLFLENGFDRLIEKWDQIYKSQPGYPLFLKLSGVKMSLAQKANGESINCQKFLKEIEEFEKLITLVVGILVQHRSFGIGIIREINLDSKQPDESNIFLTIDFVSKSNHSMSLRIAMSSLEIAYPFHLKGLKMFYPEKLTELLKSEPTVLFKHILITLKEPTSLKQIKEFMVSEIMDENTWKDTWKMIKQKLPGLNFVKIKNNLYFYEEPPPDGLGKNLEDLSNHFASNFSKLTGAEEKLVFIEEFLYRQNDDDHLSLKNAVESLLQEFEQSVSTPDQSNSSFPFPFLLAIAVRIHCPISQSTWEKGRYFLENASNDHPASEILSQSLKLIQHAATRIEFIKNLEGLCSPEERNKWGAVLINELKGGGKENFLDYWGQHFGKDSVSKIFEVIDKEYLTSLDTFTLLAKHDIYKNPGLYPGNRTQFFTKLIRALHQCHLNIGMKKDPSMSKKNFNNLYRILFEDGHLFHHLKNDPEIKQEERLNILQGLEQRTYLDNNIKREVRALHTAFKQRASD